MAVGAAIIGGLGSIIGSAIGAGAQRRANIQNMQLAKYQNNWQTAENDKAYARSVEMWNMQKCPVFGKLALILIWFMVVVLLVITLVQLRNINLRKSSVLQWSPTAAGILVYLMLRLCIWQCVKIKLKLKTWKLKISSLKNKLEPKVFVKAILLCLPLVPGLILTLLVSFVTYLLIVL